MTIWPDKTFDERSWKLFSYVVLKKLKVIWARDEIPKGQINKMQISKDLDLSSFYGS